MTGTPNVYWNNAGATMSKNARYAVHPDFAHYPAFPFPFNRWVLKVLNLFLHADTFFNQRKTKNKARQHTVAASDGTSFKVFQFMPDGDAGSGRKLPAILYFHGGAFVLTYASTHVASADFYANWARCAVFMVDYRLAPANPFPAGFNDCYDTLLWMASNADALGIDAGRIAVMGDSAGGALSAGVAQKVLDESGPALCAQVLIYPSLDRTCSTETARHYVDAPLFDSVANTRMWQVYLQDCPAGKIPPYASPSDRADLSGLPRAYVETAEFDPLCDEGADYARRLQADGVQVELNQTHGTVHGYDTVLSSAITQAALEARIGFLGKVFS